MTDCPLNARLETGVDLSFFLALRACQAGEREADREQKRRWRKKERELPETPELHERRERIRAADRERKRRWRKKERELPEADWRGWTRTDASTISEEAPVLHSARPGPFPRPPLRPWWTNAATEGSASLHRHWLSHTPGAMAELLVSLKLICEALHGTAGLSEARGPSAGPASQNGRGSGAAGSLATLDMQSYLAVMSAQLAEIQAAHTQVARGGPRCGARRSWLGACTAPR